ncbi:MAG: hypothetical protein IJT65_01915 [Eubacterium sp.]|nr:hypothetical protein [Eubacterium sp.]
MAKTDKLHKAKIEEYDEFYTQYMDIQLEVNAYLEYNPDAFKDKTILLPCDDPEWSNFTKFFAENFELLGLKKLISTSRSLDAKNEKAKQFGYQYSLSDYLTSIEKDSPNYNPDITASRGKIFILERNSNKRIDINDLKWDYLSGDGDYQSEEVTKLRDESDIICTNPPFSIYIDFMKWVIDANKQFLIIGNKGSSGYKEIFPYIRAGKIWSGRSAWSGGMWFETVHPTNYDKIENGKKMKNVAAAWFTNMEHGKLHQPLSLMTMEENLRYSKHKDLTERGYYNHYDNIDGIDVPYVDAIPSDYDGLMGVPAASFLEKWCPEQFEIVGLGSGNLAKELGVQKNYRGRTDISYTENGVHKCPFGRYLIRRR